MSARLSRQVGGRPLPPRGGTPVGGARRTPWRRLVGWWALTALVVSALLVLPVATALGEHVRVRVCRSTGGSCGYLPAKVSCALLSRDLSIASAVTALSQVTSGRDGITTVKSLDGSALVLVPRPRAQGLADVARKRLSRNGSEPLTGPLTGSATGVRAVYRFSRHDAADAWVDHYRQVEVPVVTAAVGARATALRPGVGRFVRALGFDDLDAVRVPDGVVVDVPAQAAATAYGAASARGTGPAAVTAGTLQVEVDASRRSTTTGRLTTSATSPPVGSLAALLGMIGTTGFSVVSDATGTPETLVVTGEAGQRQNGSYLADRTLTRTREIGATVGTGSERADVDRLQGRRTMQTVVLDLRNATNAEAFDALFLRAGPAVLPRTPAVRFGATAATAAFDRAGQAAVTAVLAGRIAQDGVLVRTRVRSVPAEADPALPATQQDLQQVAPGAAPTSGGGTFAAPRTDRTEIALLQGFSQDFAVPASRLTPMPGCSQ